MLFNKKRELPPLLDEEIEIAQRVDFESAISWLVGLSDDDYKTTIKVANHWRKADKEACKLQGTAYEPTTFIIDPIMDELVTTDPFIADIIEKKPSKKVAKKR